MGFLSAGGLEKSMRLKPIGEAPYRMFKNVLVEYKEAALIPNMIVTVMLTGMNGDLLIISFAQKMLKHVSIVSDNLI